MIGIGDNHLRVPVAAAVRRRDPSFKFVSLVHPSAQRLRRVEIGPGSVVMPGVLTNSAVLIGAHCIFTAGGSVDHDARIEADFEYAFSKGPAPGRRVSRSIQPASAFETPDRRLDLHVGRYPVR